MSRHLDSHTLTEQLFQVILLNDLQLTLKSQTVGNVMTPSVLAVFVPTVAFVSVTPGMCMTLSMTLGMTVGVKKTLWMMVGELCGVGLMMALVLTGGAAFMLKYPGLFMALKLVGGSYLLWTGVQLWQSKGKMAVHDLTQTPERVSRRALAAQGFITAASNPKGWAFLISLLPSFIDPESALIPQMMVMITVGLSIEFCSLLIYAVGGQTMRRFLSRSGNVQVMNRIAATLMIGVGIWLIVG